MLQYEVRTYALRKLMIRDWGLKAIRFASLFKELKD